MAPLSVVRPGPGDGEGFRSTPGPSSFVSSSSPSSRTTNLLFNNRKLFPTIVASNNKNNTIRRNVSSSKQQTSPTERTKTKRKRLQFVYASNDSDKKRYFQFPKQIAAAALEETKNSQVVVENNENKNQPTSTTTPPKSSTIDELESLWNPSINKCTKNTKSGSLQEDNSSGSGSTTTVDDEKEEHEDEPSSSSSRNPSTEPAELKTELRTNHLSEATNSKDRSHQTTLEDEKTKATNINGKGSRSSSPTSNNDKESATVNREETETDGIKQTKIGEIDEEQQPQPTSSNTPEKKDIGTKKDESGSSTSSSTHSSNMIDQRGRARSMSVSSLVEEISYGTTSVSDALENKRGCKPRANSTDGELDLPQIGLCEERTVQKMYKWRTKHSAASPRGLFNMGNTCFLNATLQCLSYLPTFCQCLARLSSDVSTGGSNSKGQKLALLFRDLLRKLHRLDNNNNAHAGGPVRPNGIVQLITSSSKTRFRLGRQEDAHEFLVHVLDMMHEGELKQAGINQRISGWRDRLPLKRLDETTLIHRVFGGYLRSQVRCTSCGYKSNTYDPMLDLCLEISKSTINSVESALKDFTHKETLDTQNQWKCSGCHKRVCATKQLTVFRPPLTLCIQLKRFSFGSSGSIDMYGGGGAYGMGCYGGKKKKGKWNKGFGGYGYGMGSTSSRKISKRIQYPEKLRLPLSDKRDCEYHLTGVVQHLGSTPNSGHYTAFVKHPSEKWYHMDDSHCSGPLSINSVLSDKDAYILFYSRCEVDTSYPKPPLVYASAQEATESKLKRSRQKEEVSAATSASSSSTNTHQHTVSAAAAATTIQPSKGESIQGTFLFEPSFEDHSTPPSMKMKTNYEPTTPAKAKNEDEEGMKEGSSGKHHKDGSPSRDSTSNQHNKKHSHKMTKLKDAIAASMKHNNTSLIGGGGGGRWSDDEEDDDRVTKMRSTMETMETKHEQQRAKHLRLDAWDAALDMGKKRKVKTQVGSAEKNKHTSFSLAVRHQQQLRLQQHGIKGGVVHKRKNDHGKKGKNHLMIKQRQKNNKFGKHNNKKFHGGGGGGRRHR